MMAEEKGIERQANKGKKAPIAPSEQRPVQPIVVSAASQGRRIGGAKDVILQMAEDFNAPLTDFMEYMA